MSDILDKLFNIKEDYKFPIVFETDNFKDEISCLLCNYVKDLKQFSASDSVVKRVDEFRRLCELSLSYYLKGIHSDSFNYFEDAIAELNIPNSPLLKTSITEEILFRGRENRDITDYSDGQMYHIPLNCRSIVSTQRYSFPGLPCLYVGASVYTCWVEMNRPSFERFQVATIQPSDEACKMKVYDLSNIPQRIGTIKNEESFKLDEYLLYWPLLAVCSIKVKNETAPFKPEYIFPQFLLEYILKRENSEKIIGIKYASIKSATICNKQLEEDWHTYVNYIFPSRSDQMNEEKCETLNKLFSISCNRSGKELQVLTRMLEMDNAKPKIIKDEDAFNSDSSVEVKLKNIFLYTRDGMKYQYLVSIFGMIEKAMYKTEYKDITYTTLSFVASSNKNITKLQCEN